MANQRRYRAPDGIPDWNRVDRSRFDDDILAELPGPDDGEWITTSELAHRLGLVPYEQDSKLRPRLNQLRDAGLVERQDADGRWVGGTFGRASTGWHRWRRTRSPSRR